MVLKIGALASGRGSNLDAILSSIEKGHIKGAEVSVVISDKPGAKALEVARSHGVPAVLIQAGGMARPEYDRLLVGSLNANGVTPSDGLVVLAGFMRILTPEFVAAFPNRVMNIHPALLPSFPGLNAQEQAFNYGVKVSGCTVHFVVPEVDAGPIIVQRAVEVEEGDTPESLAARILTQEHRIYPLAIKLFVEGRLSIEGRRVVISK